jgi:hypothetical protein
MQGHISLLGKDNYIQGHIISLLGNNIQGHISLCLLGKGITNNIQGHIVSLLGNIQGHIISLCLLGKGNNAGPYHQPMPPG